MRTHIPAVGTQHPVPPIGQPLLVNTQVHAFQEAIREHGARLQQRKQISDAAHRATSQQRRGVNAGACQPPVALLAAKKAPVLLVVDVKGQEHVWQVRISYGVLSPLTT